MSDSEYDPDSESEKRMPPPPSKSKEYMSLLKKWHDCSAEMGKKDATIDVLKMIRERQEKENAVLREENEKYVKLIDELSRAQSRRGGNNKRIKNVSKHSTASKRNATRRHSSKR